MVTIGAQRSKMVVHMRSKNMARVQLTHARSVEFIDRYIEMIVNLYVQSDMGAPICPSCAQVG